MSLTRRFVLIAGLSLLTAACATKVSQPSAPPSPSKVRFAQYQQVEMKPVTLAPAFAGHEANQKAARKIQEILSTRMRMSFPDLKMVDTEFSKGEQPVLQIEPHIKEIKFIGGAARFWAGAMAGSSAVLMEVTYRDSRTGEVVANPEFLRVAGAWSGAWSIGATDNNMLEAVSMDVVNYSSANR